MLPWLLAASLASSAPAPAGPSPLRWGLRWVAPAGCVQAPELARAVEERLGRAVFAAEPERLVDGKAYARDGGYRASLVVVDQQGTVRGSRTVDSADSTCASLTPSVVLVVALTIDPRAGRGGEGGFTIVERPTDAPRLARSSRVVATSESAGYRTRDGNPLLEVWMGVTGGLGYLGLFSWGLAGSAWYRPTESSWALEWRGAVLPYALLEDSGGKATLLSASTGLYGCPYWGFRGSVSWGVCAGVEGALLYSRADGTSVSELLGRVDLALRPRLSARLGVSAISVGAQAGLALLNPEVLLATRSGTRRVPMGAPYFVALDVGWGVPYP